MHGGEEAGHAFGSPLQDLSMHSTSEAVPVIVVAMVRLLSCKRALDLGQGRVPAQRASAGGQSTRGARPLWLPVDGAVLMGIWRFKRDDADGSARRLYRGRRTRRRRGGTPVRRSVAIHMIPVSMQSCSA